jgi:hypothetical protein
MLNVFGPVILLLGAFLAVMSSPSWSSRPPTWQELDSPSESVRVWSNGNCILIVSERGMAKGAASIACF